MNISQQAYNLPANIIAEDLNTALARNAVTVVTAPPGAGKSTLLPLTILDGVRPLGKVLMIEPRRLAARQVALRLAENIGEMAGDTVGYSIRFESKTSHNTRIEVVTEGITMRKLLHDAMLEDVGIVIFDEFHERSLTSDVTLSLVRAIQQLLRPDLRIVIMSATIDTTTICQNLDAPLIESEGRMYDVTTVLMPRERDATDTESIARDVCSAIHTALREHEGDILAFLPGQGEIMRCEELLLSGSVAEDPTIKVFPLYGLQSPQRQREAIAPAQSGERKIVLATSIAETSLTIEGVRIVIDSGFCRRMVTDQRTGLSHLETVRISQDMATQRRGRAGRLSEGVCYQLWNNAIALNMKPNRVPEILDADLSAAILAIMSWGEDDVESLPWLTMPPHSNVVKAQQLLLSLGAIRRTAKHSPTDTACLQRVSFSLTEKGRRMSSLPCHPRIANMLTESPDASMKALACDIAAIIEERDPLSQAENDTDINTRIALLRQSRQRHAMGRWSRIEKISEQYRHLINIREDNTMPDPCETGKLLAMAYPERIGMQQGNGHFRLSGGENAVISTADQLSSYDWIVVASMNTQSGNAFLASPVNPADLPLQEYDNISWNSKDGCIVAQREWRTGRLTVRSKPLHDIPRERIHWIIATAAQKEGLSMFCFDDKVKLLQRRITTVGEWHRELLLPDVSTESVIGKAADWVPMYAGNAKTSAELKKIDMCEVVWSLLSYEQRQQVEHLAPSHIQMPNGHRIRLDYRQGAEAPVLSVRLQECFGMMDTPCINDGRQPVLMELLSPGFKPVQLTQDLRSFWATTYFDVRKELRRRYPKHAWPENPNEKIR